MGRGSKGRCRVDQKGIRSESGTTVITVFDTEYFEKFLYHKSDYSPCFILVEALLDEKKAQPDSDNTIFVFSCAFFV